MKQAEAHGTSVLVERPLPLTPIAVLGFVAISTGAVRISGIPQTVLFSLFVALTMLILNRFRISRTANLIIAGIMLAYMPGFFVAIIDDRIELLSFINLLSSMFIFILAFSYVADYIQRADEHSLVKLRQLFWAIILFCIFEIFNYDQVAIMRTLYYGDVLADHTLRDSLLYGFARPTAMFSETSNLARFLSVLLALHYVLSRKFSVTFWMFLAAFVLIRSTILLYAVPVMLVIYWWGGDHSIALWSRLSAGLRSLVLGGAGTLFILFFSVSQYSRIQDALTGQDGSLSGRLLLPIRFLIDAWDAPFFGLGPTHLTNINAYVNAAYINEGRRTWLIGQDFTIGMAPTFVLIAGFGLLGLFVLGFFLFAAFGPRGLVGLTILLLVNLLGTGSNAPAMYAPTAFLLAICWSLWKPNQRRLHPYRRGA